MSAAPTNQDGALSRVLGAQPARVQHGLTQRQTETLAFIRDYVASRGGVPPSCEEIAAHLGRSKSRAFYVVEQLVERGHLSKLPYRSRSLVLTGEVSQ